MGGVHGGMEMSAHQSAIGGDAHCFPAGAQWEGAEGGYSNLSAYAESPGSGSKCSRLGAGCIRSTSVFPNATPITQMYVPLILYHSLDQDYNTLWVGVA